MLGDDRGGRRLVPTQSVSGLGVWDRLHLGVRSDALELRRVRPSVNKSVCSNIRPNLLAPFLVTTGKQVNPVVAVF